MRFLSFFPVCLAASLSLSSPLVPIARPPDTTGQPLLDLESIRQLIESSLEPVVWKWQFPALLDSGNKIDAGAWLTDYLQLSSKKGPVGQQNLDFIKAPNSPPTTSLSVAYPKGSFNIASASESSGKEGGVPLGGTSFYCPIQGPGNKQSPLWKRSLLLSYRVTFSHDFDFVKGGKLPGLYSGLLQSDGKIFKGCQGGSREEAGSKCWSVRIMWRAGGAGEVYAYIPTTGDSSYQLCGQQGVQCSKGNYGASIGRGNFAFTAGSPMTLSLLVVLNSREDRADGRISLFADKKLVIDKPGLLLRTAGLQDDTPWVDNIFFSTFFGGSKVDFASSKDVKASFDSVELRSGNVYVST
ncbi:hypothetical protein FA10DRAFT_263480 [Acaromyces ingoldii]|uniref:Polysaccharide lyase 14 domain-containing protein n=1 Tax=Acaromyces ingoldii TaxID=215250 RepID=A0A316YUE4_9BASI|nr:hypothetical protein FA10DRAFT_263480 [Acaromyces ingoldii]PWN92722.1 hypothetical protein FA10DRAFT_263480 [Acaromyces ingoldii]